MTAGLAIVTDHDITLQVDGRPADRIDHAVSADHAIADALALLSARRWQPDGHWAEVDERDRRDGILARIPITRAA